MTLAISILRVGTLLYGQIAINMLGLVILMRVPNGVIEGYAMFQSIQKTLMRSMTMRDLAFIYSLFPLAAVIE